MKILCNILDKKEIAYDWYVLGSSYKEEEFEETMFSSYGLKTLDEIKDHYRLTLAKKAYASDKLEEEITKDKSINYSIDDVGLYKENNYYFFRGNVENNYIKINDEMWRIVAILENKNIRIIKEDGINSNQLYKYNESGLIKPLSFF